MTFLNNARTQLWLYSNFADKYLVIIISMQEIKDLN